MRIKPLFMHQPTSYYGYVRTWVLVVLWVVGVPLFFAVIAFGFYQMDRLTCNQYAEESGYTVEYRIPSGCYVDTGRGVIHRDQIIDNVGN